MKHINLYFILLINFLFIFIYTLYLSQFPSLWIDEGWFSNPAYDLITNNSFRTYIFRGYLNLDDFTFWQPPVYILLLAFSFKIFGFSLFNGRMVSVVLALIEINIFYIISTRILKRPIAFILTFLMGIFPYFFISARQIRMDIAVSSFTFLSFFFLFFKYYKNELNQQKKYSYLIISGIFSGLALLSHPNGLISIFLNAFGIIFYDVPLNKKNVFSKNLFLTIYGKLKILLLFFLTIFLVSLPYLIIIIMKYDTFQIQFSTNILRSITDIWSNIINEPIRYATIILPYHRNSFLQILPMPIVIIFFGFLLTMFIAGFIKIMILMIKKDHTEAKILSIYIIGIIIFFTVFVSNITPHYLCIIIPYPFLSIAYLFSNKEEIILKLKFFNTSSLQKITPSIKKNFFHYYKIIWVISLFIIQTEILCYYLNVNREQNPYQIREVFKKLSIPKNEVIVGDASFFVVLYDYNYLDYYAIHHRLNETSFNDLIQEYNPKFFIYDAKWRSKNDTDYTEFVGKCELYFKNNCKLKLIFNTSISNFDPIYLYYIDN